MREPLTRLSLQPIMTDGQTVFFMFSGGNLNYLMGNRSSGPMPLAERGKCIQAYDLKHLRHLVAGACEYVGSMRGVALIIIPVTCYAASGRTALGKSLSLQ
ncbi:MAG: hypothetical protein V5B32_04005 [Candidatus Accumulibacter sp. UW26]|jgi:hypothetical protein